MNRSAPLLVILLFPLMARAQDAPPADGLEALRPREGDYTAAALRRYQQALVARHGREYDVPLDVKAEHLEWVLARYCVTPWNQVHPKARLPAAAGQPVTYHVGNDTATWNGALLSALSHKYAVTKDPRTLALIGRLLEGLHFYQEVTGQSGLAARCVIRSDQAQGNLTRRYVGPDGTVYHFRSDAAKGTYNQIVCGYAMLMMHVYPDLPPDKQQLARNDLARLVLHLIDHDYKLTEADGEPTEYGNLTPVFLTQGVPFNAQVAYMIVATGAAFPPDDPAQKQRVQEAFERLRHRHHVYYESPDTHLILPQRVGASPLVKGMNDRNHVLNAAHAGLAVDLHACRRSGIPLDREFLFQLGQTMYWTMEHIQFHHNALCNFLWAGLLRDPQVFACVVPAGQADRIRRQLPYLVQTGTEQLRRFPIDRFAYPGRDVETREVQWIDTRGRHDGYQWKADPFLRFEITGPPTDTLIASIDYLHAYWVMRYYRLDQP